jgi:hypothetical protein
MLSQKGADGQRAEKMSEQNAADGKEECTDRKRNQALSPHDNAYSSCSDFVFARSAQAQPVGG